MNIVDTLHWLAEYFKVLSGFLLLVFVWPHIVFKKHLNGEGIIYRFCFCISVQTVLISTVVLGLGLCHILNPWSVRAVFYGIPLIVLCKRAKPTEEKIAAFCRALSFSYTAIQLKQFFRTASGKIKRLWQIMRPHILEYLGLGVLLIYAQVFLVWGSFQTTSYGFGDQYVHHSWIYGLKEGIAFSGGIYPEAMHCLIYAIHILFDVRTYSLMLLFGSIQGIVFLISAYCLLREFFHWRYTPLFVLAAIILFNMLTWREGSGMARLQWTLPLEFGLTTQFICALYLLRYLRKKPPDDNSPRRRIWNRDLFIFMMSLSATFAAHFYPLIMAFFMCAGIAVLYLKAIFSRERFLPLVAAVLCGGLIALAPMAAAFASGTPLEKSLNWAMGVIDGNDSEYDEARGRLTDDTETQDGASNTQESGLTGKVGAAVAFGLRVIRLGYAEMIGTDRGQFVMNLTVALGALWLALRLIPRFLSPARREQIRAVSGTWLEGYLPLLADSVVFIVMYIAPYLGLPELVLGVRMASTERILLYAVAAIPLDLLFFSLTVWIKASVLHVSSMLCLGIISAWGCSPENYHGYLYCELTRYRSEVAVMDEIIGSFSPFTYTVVSPTDGLYHEIETGWHEELIDFVKQASGERYFLPTEHVFIFVEKRPIQYAQTYYFQGPSWLAMEREIPENCTQAPNILASEISEEAALSALEDFSNPFSFYKEPESRTIVESKAYAWCQRFWQLYPHEMDVYYEDDDFVCYYFRQEPNSPYNLALSPKEE